MIFGWTFLKLQTDIIDSEWHLAILSPICQTFSTSKSLVFKSYFVELYFSWLTETKKLWGFRFLNEQNESDDHEMRKRTKRIIIFFLLTPFWSAAVLLVTMNSLRNTIINQLIASNQVIFQRWRTRRCYAWYSKYICSSQ